MSGTARDHPPAAHPRKAGPGPLAIAVLILGIASWMFGCCVSVPTVGLAIAELLLIQKGRSPAAGKPFAWFGLAVSLLHAIVSTVVLAALGTGLAALLYAGGSAFIDPCDERAVCAGEGQCGTSYERAGEGLYRCYVRDELDCQRSEACREEGRCSYDPRVALRCIAPGRAPRVPPSAPSVCEQSSDCARWGRCALIEGICLASRQEDCESSLDCVVQGRCTLRGHYCVATSDDDCRRSLECEIYGRCHLASFGGLPSTCEIPGERYQPSCSYAGAGADHCALTGECLRSPLGQCETLEAHGRRSPQLEEARRRIREALPVDEPTRLR